MFFSDLSWLLSAKLNHQCQNPAPVPGTQDGINFPCLQQLELAGGTDHCGYCNVTVSAWYAQRVNAEPGVRLCLHPKCQLMKHSIAVGIKKSTEMILIKTNIRKREHKSVLKLLAPKYSLDC